MAMTVKEIGVGGIIPSPAPCCFLRGLFGDFLFALGTDNATADRDLIGQHQIESVTVLVRPDRSDFAPDGLAIAALLRIGDDIGNVRWLAHGGSSFCWKPGMGLDSGSAPTRAAPVNWL